ncbi:MAG: M1 family metallopeptidase [Alcanivoracaceae bacterium]|nr:M1 family metallopeptidase [Alcanivoracaceae bacterium]
MHYKPLKLFTLCLLLQPFITNAKIQNASPANTPDKFRQLEEILPTPNDQRIASGAPGPEYWQQRADYVIEVTLDDDKQRITGSELITYYNNSPHELSYLWLQLDQNRFAKDSDSYLTEAAPKDIKEFTYQAYDRLLEMEKFEGGSHILAIKDQQGQALAYIINKTMMRIDLPQTLKAGEKITFSIDWWHNIINAKKIRARGGYEYFKEDDNFIYEISRWQPRMAAYMDVTGWQNKQFLGNGEFTLDMSDFTVSITVPADHIVAATGELQNADEILSQTQLKRLQQARTAQSPVYIVTPKEAKKAQKKKVKESKTWIFKAENVRDFAFASSRKFIWDAQGYNQNGHVIMAMSLYPNEANPLWYQYSTAAIIHTMDVYSRYTFDYPYPVSISVNGPAGGMEYPMICFNGPRPEDDGTYQGENDDEHPWKHSKYGLISVIIHEVGHNYFPMIVNSDERQWTWMDEGLNTFLQFIAQGEWQEDYPSRRGEAKDIVEYMLSDNQVPIITNSESLLQFGNNAYAKPATALNILRETIMGRELFDFAFKEYARRWKFKHPMPSDFFRTMEDASGVDLDWFWRGWFYSTEHVDIAIKAVNLLQMDSRDPEIDLANLAKDDDEEPVTITQQRNKGQDYLLNRIPELEDFYNTYDKFAVTKQDQEAYKKLLEELDDDEKALLKIKRNFYVIDFENLGGLVMPIILKISYTDGSEEIKRIPAEIWRKNPKQVSKLLMTTKELKNLELDPYLETADTDVNNNNWPAKVVKSRFQLWKQKVEESPMKQAQKKD